MLKHIISVDQLIEALQKFPSHTPILATWEGTMNTIGHPELESWKGIKVVVLEVEGFNGGGSDRIYSPEDLEYLRQKND